MDLLWIYDGVWLVACMPACRKRKIFSMKMRQISRPDLDDMRAAAGNPNAVSLTRLLKVSFVQGPACLGGMFIYGIWLSAFHVGHYLVTCSQEGGRQLVLCSAAGLQVEKSLKG